MGADEIRDLGRVPRKLMLESNNRSGMVRLMSLHFVLRLSDDDKLGNLLSGSEKLECQDCQGIAISFASGSPSLATITSCLALLGQRTVGCSALPPSIHSRLILGYSQE